MKSYRNQKIRSEFARRLKRFSVFFALASMLIWAFFWLPWFRISQINANGFASDGDIKSAVLPYLASLNAFGLPNNNFFLLRTSRLENILKEDAIGLANVRKTFPKTIHIDFPETEPWLIYCSAGNDCYYVSEDGILSERSPHFSISPIPRIISIKNGVRLGDNIISPEDALLLRKIFQNLKKQNTYAASVSFIADGTLKITTSENWYLLISRNSNFGQIFADLKLLFYHNIKDSRPHLEYIDMRFDNKAFYKLK